MSVVSDMTSSLSRRHRVGADDTGLCRATRPPRQSVECLTNMSSPTRVCVMRTVRIRNSISAGGHVRVWGKLSDLCTLSHIFAYTPRRALCSDHRHQPESLALSRIPAADRPRSADPPARTGGTRGYSPWLRAHTDMSVAQFAHSPVVGAPRYQCVTTSFRGITHVGHPPPTSRSLARVFEFCVHGQLWLSSGHRRCHSHRATLGTRAQCHALRSHQLLRTVVDHGVGIGLRRHHLFF